MLNKRRLEIRWVKDTPQHKQLPAGPQSPAVRDDVTETVSDITDTVVSGAVTILGTYMLADTVRKIVINAFTR